MAKSVGTMFAELQLDDAPYKKAQEALYGKVSATVKGIEDGYKKLADKTSSIFKNMGEGISVAYDKIKESSRVAFEKMSGYAKVAGSHIYDAMKNAFSAMNRDMKEAFGAGWEKTKDFAANVGNAVKHMAEQMTAVWITTKLFGEAVGSVLGSIFNWVFILIAAWKSLKFVVGLFTGSAYKSESIDALIAENKAVEDLRVSMQLATFDAQALMDTTNRLGIDQKDVTTVFDGLRESLRDNRDELDRLGVKYKTVDGTLLDQRTVLENVKKKLDEYTEGWDRNQAALAIGMGSYDQINNYLKITQEELKKSKERLKDYHLGIGTETQEAVSQYEKAMLDFRNETRLMGEGISRAIADQIIPAFTSLANFFSGGWPGVVDAFRYSMATITSLLWGLKMSFDIVVDSIKGAAGALSDVFIALATAAARAMVGDFAGAKDALVQGWTDVKSRVSKTWAEMVADAQKNSSAMRMAWAFDNRETGAKAAPAQGKTWVAATPVDSTADAVAKKWRATYQAMTEANKRYYEEAVSNAENEAKMQEFYGRYELNIINELYDQRNEILTNWYNRQVEIIQKYYKDEEGKQAKLDALYSDYSKKWADNDFKRIQATRAEFDKEVSSFASGYSDIANASFLAYEKIKDYAEAAFEWTVIQLENTKAKMKNLGWTDAEWEEWFNVKSRAAEIKMKLILYTAEFDKSVVGSAKNWTAAVQAGSVAFKKYMADAGAHLKGTMFEGAGMWMSVILEEANVIVALANLATEFVNLPVKIMDAFSTLFNAIGNLGTSIRTAMSSMVSAIHNALLNLDDIVRGIVDAGVDFIKNIPLFIEELIDSIPQIIDAIIDAIPDIIAAFIKMIPDIASAFVNALIDAIKNAGSNIFGGVGDLFGGIGDVVGDVLGSIGDVFGFSKGGYPGSPTSDRYALPAYAFANAPRAASGLRLSDGGIPIVAHPGERVLNRRETEEYERGGGSSPRQIFVTVELDRRTLAKAMYDESKDGGKVVHVRGIATI